MIRWSVLLALALVLCLPAPSWDSSAEAVGIQSINIATPNRNYVFAVEIAATKEERARGLMFRKDLPQMHGMLFDFGRDREVTMWMHNTTIPLDIIFICADGQILRL